MTKYIYIETDWHANNAWGLLCPGTKVPVILPDGETYEKEFELNPEQILLHEIRSNAIKQVAKIVKKKPVTFIHLGDFIQGWKHPSHTVTDSAYEEIVMAQHNMAFLAERLNLNKIRLVLGTAAHDGIGHESVKAIHSMLSGYAKDTKMVWHGLAEVEGVTIDYAHHGAGVGIRDHLKGNQMRYYMQSLMSEEMKRGRIPPRLTLRGHFHGYHRETVRNWIQGKWITMDYVLVPSLCGMGAYAKQVTRSEHIITNGSLLLEIDGDKFHIHEFVLERDLRKKEVL